MRAYLSIVTQNREGKEWWIDRDYFTAADDLTYGIELAQKHCDEIFERGQYIAAAWVQIAVGDDHVVVHRRERP